MEETETLGTILFLVWRVVASDVDLPAARSESCTICPIRCARCGCLCGYPHDRFCLDRARSRPTAGLGNLRYGLLPGSICHSTRHLGELDCAAIHDSSGAGCGFPSRAIPSPPRGALEALGVTAAGGLKRHPLRQKEVEYQRYED